MAIEFSRNVCDTVLVTGLTYPYGDVEIPDGYEVSIDARLTYDELTQILAKMKELQEERR